jgi:type I restriction enzyme, S subunit
MTQNTFYPEMVNSNVSWLGTKPAHWDSKPLFSLAREIKAKNNDGRENKVLSLSYGKIVQRDVSTGKGLLPASFNSYQIIASGNIVLRLTDLQNDKRSLRVGLATQSGVITSAYMALELKRELDPRYAYFLLHSYDVTKVFYTLGGGVRQTIKYDDLKRLPLLIPPQGEQIAIANFLDRETQRIEVQIEKQKKLIELLKEKQTSLISQTVAKGMNPNVTMKDSDVTWIDKIPNHWEVIPNRAAFEIKKRIVGKRSSEFALLSLTLNGVILRDTESGKGKFPASFDTYQIVNPNELVFCLFDMDETPRTVGLSEYTGMVTGAYTVTQCRDSMHPSFVYYYYLSLDFSKRLKPLYTGLRKVIRIGTFLSAKMPRPPMVEQKQICEHLDIESDKIEKLIALATSAMDKLNEYRTSLTSAAVTGKIDVRDHPSATPLD